MSMSTLTAAFDDFEEWEAEVSPVRYRPTRAAERREVRTVIERGLGIVRHRTHERRED